MASNPIFLSMSCFYEFFLFLPCTESIDTDATSSFLITTTGESVFIDIIITWNFIIYVKDKHNMKLLLISENSFNNRRCNYFWVIKNKLKLIQKLIGINTMGFSADWADSYPKSFWTTKLWPPNLVLQNSFSLILHMFLVIKPW